MGDIGICQVGTTLRRGSTFARRTVEHIGENLEPFDDQAGFQAGEVCSILFAEAENAYSVQMDRLPPA